MNKKRITSLLICITMILASIPASLFSAFAFADEGGSFYSSFEDDEDYSKYVYGKVAKEEGNPKAHGVSTGAYNAQLIGEYIDNWETTGGSKDYVSEYPLKSIRDRNPLTSWLTYGTVPSTETPVWAEMKMEEEKIVRTYSISTSKSRQEYDAKSWKFFGSKDGADWQLLDSQTDQEFSDRYMSNSYTFENETAYQYYRLEIIANYTNDKLTQLGNFAMGSNEGELPNKDPNINISTGPKSSYVAPKNKGWTGEKALEVVGIHDVNEHAYRYNVLYEGLNIPVGENTQLSYLIFPDNNYASMYMAVDILFTDGKYLSELEAVDQNGNGMSAKAQGESKTLYTEQWNEIYSNIGDVAKGRAIDSILVAYDNPFTDIKEKDFRSYFDDITIETVEPIVHDNLSDYVNILRGTNDNKEFSRGLTAPVVTVPNGFNFWAPATTNNGNKLYNYYDTAMTHFTISHEPSIWIGDRGTFQFMPNTSISEASSSNVKASSRKATFSHDNEIAKAHYYGVQFDEGSNASGVKMEVTPTDHAAAVRFTFPADSENRNIIFDSVNALSGGDLIFSEDGKSFTAKTNHTGNGMTPMYIYGEFDVAASNTNVVNSNAANGMVSFPEGTKQVTMKIATSFISTDQAKQNLKLEISRTDKFDNVLSRAQSEWDEILGTIELEGATYDQMVTFYSNMYRMYAYPNSLSENTGTKRNPVWKYSSPYSGDVSEGIFYYNNGFWDSYRTTWAAYALFTPEKNTEMLNGLVQHYDDQGWVPRWIAPGGVNCMVGTNSDVIFGDAIMRGQEFNYENAYLSAVRNASVVSSNPTNGGRAGLETSIFRGYTSTDTGEGMSWSLEGYINDYGIANMAKALRDKVEDKESEKYKQYNDEYQYFLNRAQNYVKLFDDNIDFFQGKSSSGNWRNSPSKFNPIEWGYDYTETNAWNMAFSAPQDGQGLANLYGGREGLEKKLDDFFNAPAGHKVGSYGREIHEMREAKEVRMGQYGHSNQPSHHIPYMYLYAGQPSKTQEKVREILDRLYVGESIGQGYCGDEDNGEMSAWYVLSSLGIYPVNMGSGEFAIGSPLFTKATVHLENGKDLVINAPNNSSENIYVQGVKLNGQSWNKTYFDHSDIAKGGVIDFEMGSEPSTWGTDEAALPTSITEGNEIAVPDKDITDKDPSVLESEPTENQSVDSIYVKESVTDIKNLFDDSSKTAPTFTTSSATIYFAFDSIQSVNMYTITSGTDVQGAPSNWTLYGSNDNKEWVELDKRSDQSFRWEKYTRPFALDKTASYQNYKLEIATNGEKPLNISEIEFLGYNDDFDFFLLQDLINKAFRLKEKDYTSSTWKVMNDELDKAQKVLVDGASTSAQQAEAYNNLKAAMEALVKIADLQVLVDECLKLDKADYTDESWKAFDEQLDMAYDLLKNEAASQDQVDKAFAGLEQAKSELILLSSLTDKTALQELADECQALKKEDYKDDNWAAFEDQLNKAKALLADDKATQTQVDNMCTLLSIAKSILIPVEDDSVDKTALEVLISLAQKAKDKGEVDDAIPSMQAEFNKAFEEAQKVFENADATQDEVDMAAYALSEAIPKLGFIKGEKEALRGLFDLLSKINLDYYQSGDAKEAFELALAEADTVIANGDAMQEEVDEAYSTLLNAYLNLKILDKSKLESEVAISEMVSEELHKYVEAGQAEFKKALTDAKTVLDNENATQADINAARIALVTARANLRYRADKDLLSKRVARAASIDLSLYTDESVAVLNKVVEEAKALLDDVTLSEEDQNLIDKIAEEVENAIDGLLEDNSSDIESSGNSSDTESSGNSSDTENSSNASSSESSGNASEIESSGSSSDTESSVNSSDKESSGNSSNTDKSKSASNDNSKAKVAKTGDEAFILLLAMTTLCLSMIVIYKRKKANK